MPSTQYLNMINQGKLFVFYDFKPWGGAVSATTIPIPDARVTNVKLGAGSGFDTATVVLPSASFGDTTGYFLPLKIVYIEPVSGTQKVLFRGFINEDSQTITTTANTVTVSLVDYRWYISRRTQIRGRWYRHTSASAGTPNQLGSGLTAGAGKFVYEKFRANIQDNAGYLQNEETVFNKNGFPDCYIDNNTTSILPVFYLDDIDYDESEGLNNTFFEKKVVNGFYWTYATILRHIEEFWIQPYNATFAGINFDNGDLSDIAAIPDDIARPMNFSINNQNPLSAVDSVVRALPGKWMWYLDYNSSLTRVKIRIKEITTAGVGTVQLIAGDNTVNACEPLKDSDANITSVTVKRDINSSVKNVIAKGGKIKVVTTIKLVPLWTRYGLTPNKTNFENDEDKAGYVTFLKDRINNADNELLFENKAEEGTKLEWLRKFRYYGIPLEGQTWADAIVDSTVSGGTVNTDLLLTGDIASHYTALSTNLKEMMFNGVRIDREIAPPQYKRFSDDIVVFLHDNKRTGQLKLNATTVANREARTENGPAANIPHGIIVPGVGGVTTLTSAGGSGTITINGDVATTFDTPEANATDDPDEVGSVITGNRWIVPDREDLNYKIDEKNGIVIFDVAQVQAGLSTAKNKKEQQLSAITEISSNNIDDIQSRDVYMTATFTLDVSALISKRIGLFGGGGISVVDLLDGPNFTEYINHNDADIVIHNSAFYPLSATEKENFHPEFSDDIMDGKAVGRAIRAAQSFDDYKFYESLGALELMTAINSFLEGQTDLQETVSATLPYLEIGYNLGDPLFEIQNTSYSGLKSFLNSINYTSVGESDVYSTKFNFSNNYKSSKTKDTVSNKNNDTNASGNKREILEHDNLAQNVLV